MRIIEEDENGWKVFNSAESYFKWLRKKNIKKVK